MDISDPNLLNNSVFSYRLINTLSSISLRFYLWMRTHPDFDHVCATLVFSLVGMQERRKRKSYEHKLGSNFRQWHACFPSFLFSQIASSNLSNEWNATLAPAWTRNIVHWIESIRLNLFRFSLSVPPVWSVKETGEGLKESEWIANTDLCRNLRDQGWPSSE